MTDYYCPLCGSEMKPREGRYGRFFGCTKFPSCKGTRKSSEFSVEKMKEVYKAKKHEVATSKFEAFRITVEHKTFFLRVQSDLMRSKNGSGRLPRTEHYVWVTDIDKAMLAHLDIEVAMTLNRYGGWFYLVSETVLDDFPWMDTMDNSRKIHIPTVGYDTVTFEQVMADENTDSHLVELLRRQTIDSDNWVLRITDFTKSVVNEYVLEFTDYTSAYHQGFRKAVRDCYEKI